MPANGALCSTHMSVPPFEFCRTSARAGQGQVDAQDDQGRVPVSVPYHVRSRGGPAVVAALQSPDVVASDRALLQET